MMAVAAFALAIGNVRADTINRFFVGVYDEKDISAVFEMFEAKDAEALAQFVEQGKGVVLKAGTKVTFVDLHGLLAEHTKVRVRGSAQGVWLPSEFVTHN